MRMRIVLEMLALFSLLVALGMASVACGGDTDEVCAKIYETCQGALQDEEGTSLSQESCIRKMEALSEQEPQQAEALFRCIAEAKCEDLAGCFTQL